MSQNTDIEGAFKPKKNAEALALTYRKKGAVSDSRLRPPR